LKEFFSNWDGGKVKVLDARLVPLPAAFSGKAALAKEAPYHALLLSTTYIGDTESYYRLFWNKFRDTFIRLGQAAKDPPAERLDGIDDPDEARFAAFAKWVDDHNLTQHIEAPHIQRGGRNQFTLVPRG